MYNTSQVNSYSHLSKQTSTISPISIFLIIPLPVFGYRLLWLTLLSAIFFCICGYLLGGFLPPLSPSVMWNSNTLRTGRAENSTPHFNAIFDRMVKSRHPICIHNLLLNSSPLQDISCIALVYLSRPSKLQSHIL